MAKFLWSYEKANLWFSCSNFSYPWPNVLNLYTICNQNTQSKFNFGYCDFYCLWAMPLFTLVKTSLSHMICMDTFFHFLCSII